MRTNAGRRAVQVMVAAAMLLVSSVLPSRAGAADAPLPPAPSAERRPHEVVSPHGTRNDDYYWLRDDSRQNPEVLAYLKAENAYFAAYSARYQPLQDKLLAELRGRVVEDDSTVPYQRRLLVLHALRRRQGIPDPRPQARRAHGAGRGDGRRQLARRRQGLFRCRRPGRQ